MTDKPEKPEGKVIKLDASKKYQDPEVLQTDGSRYTRTLLQKIIINQAKHYAYKVSGDKELTPREMESVKLISAVQTEIDAAEDSWRKKDAIAQLSPEQQVALLVKTLKTNEELMKGVLTQLLLTDGSNTEPNK